MPMMNATMSATALRQRVPSRRRRGHSRPTVESLLDQIGGLTAERQRLREEGADGRRLEQNRLALVRAQWDLSHALIERYLPSVA